MGIQFDNYVTNFLRDKCEGESFQLTALTGYNVKGAGKSKGDKFYSDHINCLAYIDGDNKLVKKEIKLLYFLDNTPSLQFLNVDNLTGYDFIVKKVKNKELYYIIKLVGKSKTDIFDSIIEEQSKPLVITENDDVFTYDRALDWYEGEVVIGDKKISVMLLPEPDTTDATESLNTFRKIKNDFQNFYKTVLLRCSQDMVTTANDWREEDDTHEITAEEIYRRIDSDTFDLEISEKYYSVYLDDDDLFCGHTILYNGSIENDEFETTLAG